MGIFWKFAMPLLSTLAALVIIVHSAEEDLQMEEQRNMRPRTLEMATPNYEQPWRVVEPNLMMQHSTQPESWPDNSPEGTPKRRRPGRKRQRRPQQTSTDELIPKESHPEIVYRQFDISSRETTDQPRRRRKRPVILPDHWTDEPLEAERPLRRRVQRKKRPSLDSNPPLSEFDFNHRPSGDRDIPNETVNVDDEHQDNFHGSFVNRHQEGFNKDEEEPDPESSKHHTEDKHVQVKHFENDDQSYRKDDKSLSEFSYEVLAFLRNNSRQNLEEVEEKSDEKPPTEFNSLEKAQDNSPIDPLTLKDILKRSNGTSLSEILQQHNLSLSDLLHGREKAISVLKSESNQELKHDASSDLNTQELQQFTSTTEKSYSNKEIKEENSFSILNKHYETTTVTASSKDDTLNSDVTTIKYKIENVQATTDKGIQQNPKRTLEFRGSAIRNSGKRRFPPGIRRKLRLKPMLNGTYKNQLNRDLIVSTTRKYSNYFHRNFSKSQEWREIIPIMLNNNASDKQEDNNTNLITTVIPEDATVPDTTPITTTSTDIQTTVINKDNERTTVEIVETTIAVTEMVTTEKPKISLFYKPTRNNTALRQAFNNRMKWKQPKKKIPTTIAPHAGTEKHTNDLGNFVSASEFIASVQAPKTTTELNPKETVTTTEEYIITEASSHSENTVKSTKQRARSTTSRPVSTTRTLEQVAKLEIQEILNDTKTRTRLSKILKERNMTLNELLDHRERGSSHVHLADIFHNASKEPNPPEPFLSKSLLEPISKETYPLRALLEANLHDATKMTTTDASMTQTNYLNIPIVMDFGNNVNENGDMGIMSLFNKITRNDLTNEKSRQEKPSIKPEDLINDIRRDSRVFTNDADMVNWNEIIELIEKTQTNKKKEFAIPSSNELLLSMVNTKNSLEDIDEKGLFIQEDLQNLHFDSNSASTSSEDKIIENIYEKNQIITNPPPFVDIKPSTTKSVAIATASIVGFSLILFLLTYLIFKWKNQSIIIHNNESFSEDNIPTPVFENRKCSKINSSTRSISPIISSNVYTMNTIDNSNGKDSLEYTWDSLRTPFQ